MIFASSEFRDIIASIDLNNEDDMVNLEAETIEYVMPTIRAISRISSFKRKEHSIKLIDFLSDFAFHFETRKWISAIN